MALYFKPTNLFYEILTQAMQERDGELTFGEYSTAAEATFDRVEVETITREAFDPGRGGLRAQNLRQARKAKTKEDRTADSVKTAQRLLDSLGMQGDAGADDVDMEDLENSQSVFELADEGDGAEDSDEGFA